MAPACCTVSCFHACEHASCFCGLTLLESQRPSDPKHAKDMPGYAPPPTHACRRHPQRFLHQPRHQGSVPGLRGSHRGQGEHHHGAPQPRRSRHHVSSCAGGGASCAHVAPGTGMPVPLFRPRWLAADPCHACLPGRAWDLINEPVCRDCKPGEQCSARRVDQPQDSASPLQLYPTWGTLPMPARVRCRHHRGVGQGDGVLCERAGRQPPADCGGGGLLLNLQERPGLGIPPELGNHAWQCPLSTFTAWLPANAAPNALPPAAGPTAAALCRHSAPRPLQGLHPLQPRPPRL